MTARLLNAFVISAVLPCLGGCDKSPSAATGHAQRIVGTWEPPDESGETIEFLEGGTWIGRTNRGGAESGGNWSIDGDVLRFEYKAVKGQPAAKEEIIQYRIESIDGKLMHLAMPSGYIGEWKRIR